MILQHMLSVLWVSNYVTTREDKLWAIIQFSGTHARRLMYSTGHMFALNGVFTTMGNRGDMTGHLYQIDSMTKQYPPENLQYTMNSRKSHGLVVPCFVKATLSVRGAFIWSICPDWNSILSELSPSSVVYHILSDNWKQSWRNGT